MLFEPEFLEKSGKMEFQDHYQLYTKNSVLDVAGFLDSPLITFVQDISLDEYQ